MPTVAHVVKKLVKNRPFVAEGLRRNIISHAGLAEDMMPEVERILDKEVTFSAVNMAVRRLAEHLETKKTENILFDIESDITVRSQIVAVTVHKTQGTQARIRKLYDALDIRDGDFLTVTQGLHEMMVVTNERHLGVIRTAIPAGEIKNVSEGLSLIFLVIPETAADQVGMFYTITRALAWESINIVDIVSTYTELAMLIHERHTGRAFDVLREIIAPSSRSP